MRKLIICNRIISVDYEDRIQTINHIIGEHSKLVKKE